MIIHANKYDTLEMWCSEKTDISSADLDGKNHEVSMGEAGAPPDDLSDVTCLDCLDAIMAYGSKAMCRKFDLVDECIEEMKAAKR